MSSNIGTELQDYIGDNSSLIVSESIFLEDIPQNVAAGAMIAGSGGAQPSRTTQEFFPTFRVVGRGGSIDEALEKWLIVFNLLHQRSNYDLANYRVFFSLGLSDNPILILNGPRVYEYESFIELHYKPR